MSLSRLSHCEYMCGCYQKEFLFPRWDELVSTFQHAGFQLKQVCRSNIESELQFFSCFRKKWAQVTDILFCTSRCFLFCWAARLQADLNLWFSCEIPVYSWAVCSILLVNWPFSFYCYVISCLFWIAGLWRSEFVTDLPIICGHCLFQIDLWSSFWKWSKHLLHFLPQQ